MDAQYAGDLYFNRPDHGKSAVFGDRADFADAHIDGLAVFSGTRFKGVACFLRTKFGSDAFFRPDPPGNPVVFESTAEFTGSRFITNAHFPSVQYVGQALFDTAEVAHEIHFENAQFQDAVIFREARFGIIHFSLIVINSPWWLSRLLQKAFQYLRDLLCWLFRKSSPQTPMGQFNGPIDMRGMSYERVYLEWEPFLQKLKPYDRQPYSEMETAFRRMGEDRGANDVYHARRIHEMQNRWGWNHRAQWAGFGIDVPHLLVAGFGVRPVRFLFVIVGLLAIGTELYCREGAVVRRNTIGQPLVTTEPVDLNGLHAFWVSLDQLLPSPVDVQSGRRWEPSSNTLGDLGGIMVSYADFATLQSLVGWILVPIGILILTGALRRSSQHS